MPLRNLDLEKSSQSAKVQCRSDKPHMAVCPAAGRVAFAPVCPKQREDAAGMF